MTTKPMDNYELVLKHDKEIFLSLSPDIMMYRTHTSLSPDHSSIAVPMLNKIYLVSLADGSITDSSGASDIPVSVKLLVMHYLIYSKDTASIIGDEIPFHSIKGISHFESAFLRDTVPVLKKAFEGHIAEFVDAGRKLGGTVRPYGDAAIRLNLFPLIPITYILFEGDDEFPMNINVLFDRGITSCIHPEDVPVLGSYGAAQLAHYLS